MKKILFLISAILAAATASAQIAEFGRAVQINRSTALKMAPKAAENPITIEGDNILLVGNDGTVTRIHPVDCAGYIWASLSPDGSRLMFVAAGHGVYITDLAGNVLSNIPDLQAPVWVNNDVIAAMISTDDGHQFSSSQIVLSRADGSEIQDVTDPGSFTFEPVVSSDRNAIIYHTIDGVYYQMPFTLNK